MKVLRPLAVAVALCIGPQSMLAQPALIDGQVTKVDQSAGKITIRHGPAKRLGMEQGMTMVYKAQDPAMLKAVKAGDKIKFDADQVNGFGASHYAGNVAVVLGDPKTMQSFPAGAANTILAGEVSSGFRAWGDPLNARDPRHGISGGPHAFGAPRRAPQFVMLDGSVRTFDPQELAELMSKTPE